MPNFLADPSAGSENDEDINKKHRYWINSAKKYHGDKYKKEADRFIGYFKNEFPRVTPNDPIQVYFNYYNVNVKRLLPQLLPLNIRFNLRSKGGDKIELPTGEIFDNKYGVAIEEEEVNDYWKRMQTKYHVKMSEIDALITNLGIIKTEWRTPYTEEQVIPEEMKNLLEEKAQNGEQIPGEMPTPVIQPKLSGDPDLYVERMNPLKTYIDPTSKDPLLDDICYVIHEVDLTKDRAMKSVYWEKLKEYKPNKAIQDDSENKKNRDLPAAQVYTLYEVYDKLQMKLVVYFNDKDDPIYESTFKTWPILFLRFNLEPNTVYPGSDFKYYETQAQEKAAYRTWLANHIQRMMARKIIYDTNTFNEDQIKKLKSNADMEYIGADLKGRALKEVIDEIVSKAVDFDVWKASGEIDGEVQVTSGVNSLRTGAGSDGTATAASITQGSFQDMQTEKIDVVKDFCERIARNIIALLKENVIESRDIELEQEDGSKEWTKWDRSQIEHCKEIIDVEFTPTLPTEAKAQREENFMNIMMAPPVAQALAQGKKRVNYTYLIESYVDILKSGKDLEKLIVDIPPAPDDPMLENELMMNGQETQVMEGQNHEEHMMAHMRFMQSPIFKQLPQPIQDYFVQHLEMTKNALVSSQPVKQGGSVRPDLMNKGPQNIAPSIQQKVAGQNEPAQ